MSDSSERITPVVLAGGKGTRLWPLSRASRPKQFLALTGELSLFQQTLLRISGPGRYGPAIVTTSEEYRFLVAEQALECGVPLGAILLEPVTRGTAAAIAVACLAAVEPGGDPIVHVLPSDHEIGADDAYWNDLETAIRSADAGRLVTFGIKPTEPATGFGYIEAGDREPAGSRRVVRFVEKPSVRRARQFLATGNHFWNSGMFVFRAGRFLGECEALAPEVFFAARAAFTNARPDLDFIRLDVNSFVASPDLAVDVAIFEKTGNASVVEGGFEWSDLGTWHAVWKAAHEDGSDNVLRGPVSLFETRASLAFSQRTPIIIDGLDDVVVIASEDAIYVGRLTRSQHVGTLVERLRQSPATRPLTEVQPTTYRPWGGYTTVVSGDRFLVKRITVKPGRSLSLQKHAHRAEHWTVVRGTAEIQIGDTVGALHEDESAYIPQGDLHRLSNPGTSPLELIEIQTGSYLGEDDIIRYEDEFGRN